jgi:hypothetical protein
MPEINHQTVRLSKGSHRSPKRGVCVMELASLLADEPFSDRPQAVCPVIAGFLRSYNDGVGDRDRADLYRFASEAIGSRAGPQVEARRAELCRRWAALWRGELGHGLRGLPARGEVIDLVLENVPLREDRGRRALGAVLREVTSSAGAFGVIGIAGLVFSASGLMREIAAYGAVYGTIATVIAFAFFVFLCANVFVLRAELAATRPRVRGR